MRAHGANWSCLSAATIDRLLAPCRVSLWKQNRFGARPGTLLGKEMPERTEHWGVHGPEWVDADAVAHCGESVDGDFCWSLTAMNVDTQWTETRAVWNRSQHNVRQRIVEIEKALAFSILGFDLRESGEFLDWHLADYFLKRSESVVFTRSRPHHKNGNARVGQKNWTQVRQLVDYGRLGDSAQARLLTHSMRRSGVSSGTFSARQ